MSQSVHNRDKWCPEVVARVASLAALAGGCLVIIGWMCRAVLMYRLAPGLSVIWGPTALCLMLMSCSLWVLSREIAARRTAQKEVRQLARIYAVLTKSNQMILRVRDRRTLFEEACRIAVEEGRLRMACIGLLGEGQGVIRVVARAGVTDENLDQIQIAVQDGPEGQDTVGTAIREGREVISHDIEQDPRMSVWRREAVKRGYRSVAAFPLKVGGRAIGAYVLCSEAAHFFDEQEVRLLNELAADLSFAIGYLEKEEQHQQAEEALRVSEERLRSIWERSADGMRLTDGEGRMLAVNGAYCRLVKMRRDELEGRVFSVTYKGHAPTDGIEVYQRRFQTGDIVPRLRTRVQLWNSEELDLEISNSFIESGQQGKILLSIFRDIGERKALEDQLRQSQKLEAIGRLAGGVAHDFNNLLLVIGGNAELLLMEPSQHNARSLEGLKQIKGAGERAANLTRQLLAFGRKQIMQSQPLILNDVIGNLSKMLNRIIGEDIQLQCRYAAGLPYVQADPGMLEQVLVNLAVNARDAMPGGGQLFIATEKVSLSAASASPNREARAGEFACLTVTDTGTGIATEHLPRIFEPFFTTKEIGRGTGLGLATVYGIVKQHEGWVEVSSRVGAGTTFKVFLPTIPAPAETATPQLAEVAPPRGTETILLVEDDHAVRDTTRFALESFGYKVYEAACAREAISTWGSHAQEIALLLSDIVMPGGVNGHELAQQLRAARPDLRVILMSGYSDEIAGKHTEFFHRSRAHFLQKPCTARGLLEAVRGCLDRKAKAARN